MTISLSDKQRAAIATIKDWYSNRTKQQQVCRVFGYAGVGKSTIVKYAIEELGLSTDKQGEVLYAAFTGKAALVMTRKGTPASTIHSLVYRVSEATPQEIEKLEKEAAQIRAGLHQLGVAERLFEEARLRSLELRLKDAHKPRFVLNAESAVRDCKLLVLDEVSMVGAEMARDLLAFGKPTLVLGDPGQLPPVKGEGAFDTPSPDVMLTEVHRQAGESAVLRLATLAREGQWIPYGHHDDFVWKMRRTDVGPQQLLKADQVICGRNATRIQLNVAMKRAAGFDTTFPEGSGEKLICLKTRATGAANALALPAAPDLHSNQQSQDFVRASVLALDLGTTTGWAMQPVGGRIQSGTVSFRPSRYDGGGMRYLRFRGWLNGMARDAAGLAAIYFEEVRRHAGTDAAHLYGGFLATLTSWCEQQGIAYQGVPVGTIKRFITGKGNADKTAVIQAVRARGFAPADDNEADAIAILLWSIETDGGAR